MDDNLSKVFWVIAAIVIIGALGLFIVSPTYNKVQAQSTEITNIDYTAPAAD